MDNNRHYSDLDRIRSMVDDAINSGNYNQLSKNISDTINQAIHTAKDAVNQTRNAFGANGPGGFDYKTPYGSSGSYEQGARENHYKRRTYSKNKNYGTPPFTGWPFSGQTAGPAANQTGAPARTRKESTSLPGRVSGILFLVFGWILFGIMLTVLLILGIVALATNSYAVLERFFLALILPFTTASVVMIWRGSYLRRRIKRYYFYIEKFNGRPYASIKDLAEGSGNSPDYVLRDIKQMMEAGMFPNAHLGDKGTCIMLDNEAYEAYLKMKEGERLKAEEEAAKAAKEPETEEQRQLRLAITEGQEYIREIRRLNDDIPGEEISRKLDRTELILKRIFSCLESHPEQLPDMKKFMGYYLPTTLKLVRAYREFDKQPVAGENITSGKQEIERTMDTINEAFENLLDDLFQDTAWDISTDISVLKTMLAQEGLTEDKVKARQPEDKDTSHTI